MLALHNWPRPVKRLVLTGAALLVALAYAALCAATWFAATLLFGA